MAAWVREGDRTASLSGHGWIERPADPAPAVAGDLTCEIAVVGGGLGGMAAALRLAELGHDVVLLESDVCGWGASSRNAGYVTGTVGSDPRILSRFYADRERGLYRFANNAVKFLEGIVADRGLDCDYEQTGVLTAAVTHAGLRKLRASVKTGRRSAVGTAAELGVPPSFLGGIHVKVGGVLDPGKLSMGLREEVLASSARVFEQTLVRSVSDDGESVRIEVPYGTITAERVLLTTNAFTNDLAIAPRHLATPVWTTAVETEPVSPEELDAAGWTSRTPIVTAHFVMHSFRTTARQTIVHTTRNLQMDRRPRPDRLPTAAVAEDLTRGFRDHFPTLRHVAPARAWGGWIGMTPANIAVAGQVSPRVLYSLACNGHGLPQAPWVATMLADHLDGAQMSEDLEVLWRAEPRFAPGIVNPFTIRLGWVADRVLDRIGSLHR